MKYVMSIHEEAATEIIDQMNNGGYVTCGFIGKAKALAECMLDNGNKMYLILFEGSLFDFILAKLAALTALIDCVRIGWPELGESK